MINEREELNEPSSEGGTDGIVTEDAARERAPDAGPADAGFSRGVGMITEDAARESSPDEGVSGRFISATTILQTIEFQLVVQSG